MAKNGNVVALGDHPRARMRLTPQESASVLKGCRELALDRMARALSDVLDRVEDEPAREKRSAIESTFRQHFVEFFNRKVLGESAYPVGGAGETELALVAPEALEESIAVSEMSRKLQSACESELFALGQRMGFLLERPELADDANPVSPATICAALKDACDEIPSDFKVRLALLRQIELHAVAELLAIYKDLNAHLVEHRILPDVRIGARRAPLGSRPTAPQGVDAPKPAVPADVFGTLAQLLGATPPLGGATLPTPSAEPPQAFVAELTRLGREPVAVQDAGAAPRNVLREIRSAAQSAPVGGVDALTIDIVAMLFDYVFEDRDIPASVKALLGRLQIPVLKVALLDKSFFSSKAHPARRMVDLLAEASLGLEDGQARAPATLTMIEGVVDAVRADFDTDIAVFEAMAARVEAFIAASRDAESDVVQRSAQLIEAREREEIARLAGEEEVMRRLLARVWAPAPVREMLLHTWTRAFAAVSLVEGEGSNAWQALVLTMDDLLWSVEPKVTPEDRKRLVVMLPGMLKRMHDGFLRAGMPNAERDVFLGALVDCHANAVKSGLRGLAALPEAAEPHPPADPKLEREVLAAGDLRVEEIRLRLPRGTVVRNVFTRAGIWTNLQRGTWVEFAREAGGALRTRLTWISPNKGVYLFTNPVAVPGGISISPEALAEKMRLGEARVLDDAPLIERAVGSVLESLRKSQG